MTLLLLGPFFFYSREPVVRFGEQRWVNNRHCIIGESDCVMIAHTGISTHAHARAMVHNAVYQPPPSLSPADYVKLVMSSYKLTKGPRIPARSADRRSNGSVPF